ncbi:MAG: NAD(P)(+) transhydrogenase (Re/Si-specific) subunit beta, partial [Deltaproteobacteria bacterium]
MVERLRILAYICASLLFVMSLRGLSTQETARRGNLFGVIGMALAVVMTTLARLVATPGPNTAEHVMTIAPTGLGMLGGAIIVGAIVGSVLAARVAMTSMPELVAILHSFVGAAAVLVGFATYLSAAPGEGNDPAHLAEVYVGVLVGAITFTGSVIAFLKLRAVIGSKPLLLPGRHMLNAVTLIACVVLGYLFLEAPGTTGVVYLGAMTA